MIISELTATATIFAMSFGAVFLVMATVLSWPMSSRAQVRRSLDRLTEYEAPAGVTETADGSFLEQVVRPLFERLTGAAGRWSDTARIEKFRHRLVLAGMRELSAEKFLAFKLALAGGAAVLYLLLVLPWSILSGWPWWLGLIFLPLGYFMPDLWLGRHVERRQRRIGASLADTIDILTIGIEAGLGFDSALARIVKNMDGPLSEEFGRALGELQMGVPRAQALRSLSERTTVRELQKLCSTIIQADKLGISVSKILRTEAGELRTRRRQFAEEQALKTPVKMVFPIILFILPALILVIIGPGVIRITDSLF